ncbi:hypothetical protein AAY473_023502 [Plecturocebus cupreus]
MTLLPRPPKVLGLNTTHLRQPPCHPPCEQRLSSAMLPICRGSHGSVPSETPPTKDTTAKAQASTRLSLLIRGPPALHVVTWMRGSSFSHFTPSNATSNPNPKEAELKSHPISRCRRMETRGKLPHPHSVCQNSLRFILLIVEKPWEEVAHTILPEHSGKPCP